MVRRTNVVALVFALLLSVVASHAAAPAGGAGGRRAGGQRLPAPEADAQADRDAGPATRPATRPTTRAATAGFEVYEWAVFVADPAQPEMNAVGFFPSALPEFVAAKRAAVPASAATTQPSPAGVIRFVGPPPSDGGTVDALLELKAGRFLTHWPRAKSRANRLLWDNLELLAEPANLEEVSPQHWYAALRGGSSAHLRRGRRGERFLLYDAEINHPNPLRLEGGAGFKYQASNTGAAALHDVQIYKPTNGGWRVGGAAQVVSTSTSPSPAPAPAARSGSPTASTTKPTGASAGAPTTGPASTAAGVAVTLAEKAPANPADVVAPWKDRLATLGLTEPDLGVALSVLRTHAVDPKRLTVVYRLDPAEMDRLLPLEVTPTPRKTVRVGLVIVRNLDPGIGEDVDRLIAQLGDDDWAKREAAHKQLAEIGPSAKGKLEAATKHKDLEIVWRAERLLQVLSPPPPQPR